MRHTFFALYGIRKVSDNLIGRSKKNNKTSHRNPKLSGLYFILELHCQAGESPPTPKSSRRV
nr:MAG TPA: hypothetical protein [Caudoviricetes sp.]